jgi:hypothetical protein
MPAGGLQGAREHCAQQGLASPVGPHEAGRPGAEGMVQVVEQAASIRQAAGDMVKVEQSLGHHTSLCNRLKKTFEQHTCPGYGH